MLAYLYSPFGREARRRFRQKLNRVLVAKLREQRPDAKGPDLERRMAILCSLINAKIWLDIRDDHGFTGEEMGTAVEWALRTLIKAL